MVVAAFALLSETSLLHQICRALFLVLLVALVSVPAPVPIPVLVEGRVRVLEFEVDEGRVYAVLLEHNLERDKFNKRKEERKKKSGKRLESGLLPVFCATCWKDSADGAYVQSW